MTNDIEAIWVISDVAPDGTYVTTVHAGEDVAVTLDRDRAVAYAVAVLAATTRARYDAAVWRQMLTISGGRAAGDGAEEIAALVVRGLREDRPPIDDSATAPLAFEPFVSHRTKEPGVFVSLNGKKISQWDVSDAEGHALHVLQIMLGVDLDASYWRHLIGTVGLEDWRARAIVGDLGKYHDSS